MSLTRREFAHRAVGGAALAAAGPSMWARLLANPHNVVDALVPLGPLTPPDALGIRLPPGFTARVIARTGDEVGDTGHLWHIAPDGGATFARPGGGWWYCSNSEVKENGGGASSIAFTPSGAVDDAFPILSNTSRNCAGGPTPWGTWLSCEETLGGQVWECDPAGLEPAMLRAGLGTFRHEAASIDPTTGDVFLTEDHPEGRLYRFVPDAAGDLSSGQLFAAALDIAPSTLSQNRTAAITWQPTSSDEPDRNPSTAAFDGGEGTWIHDRRLLFTSKGDDRVWSVDLDTDQLSLLHDCIATPDTPLGGVDNLTVHTPSGAIVIAEDQGDMQLCVLRETTTGLSIDALCEVTGQEDSELTGPAFSPDGQRLYFSSQRGIDTSGLIRRGITYEIAGPFDLLLRGPINDGAPSRPLRPAQRIGTTVGQ